MLEEIRKKIGGYFLKKEAIVDSKAPKKLQFGNVRSIGIIFLVSDKTSFLQVKSYVTQLKEMGIRSIKAIGYVPEKELPEYATGNLYFDFFGKKECNWYFKPAGPKVQTFCKETYEVLIDLSNMEDFQCTYLMGIAKAGIKVGRACDEKAPWLDLMIQTGNDKSIRYLIEQVNHYLNTMNQTMNHAS